MRRIAYFLAGVFCAIYFNNFSFAGIADIFVAFSVYKDEKVVMRERTRLTPLGGVVLFLDVVRWIIESLKIAKFLRFS